MVKAQIFFLVILGCLAFYVTRLRRRLYDRVAYSAILGGGAVLVVWPDLSITAAHALGISRGADLMFYLFVLCGLFFAVTSSAKIRELERSLTATARQLAVLQAREPVRPPATAPGNPPRSEDGRSET